MIADAAGNMPQRNRQTCLVEKGARPTETLVQDADGSYRPQTEAEKQAVATQRARTDIGQNGPYPTSLSDRARAGRDLVPGGAGTERTLPQTGGVAATDTAARAPLGGGRPGIPARTGGGQNAALTGEQVEPEPKAEVKASP